MTLGLLLVIAAVNADLAKDALLSSYPGPLECRVTACTEYDYVPASGYLYCRDTADLYASSGDDQLGAFPPGHWRFVEGELEDQELNLMSFGYADVEY